MDGERKKMKRTLELRTYINGKLNYISVSWWWFYVPRQIRFIEKTFKRLSFERVFFIETEKNPI